jgi:uncharacterized protein with von Willebrand factor type A (vWA) domain
MVDFIRVLRAAGVRVSLAESMDAMRGVRELGVHERDVFRLAMRATLVKEARDQAAFEYFFPLFFGQSTPPMENIPDGLNAADQQKLEDALQSLMGDLQALRELLRQALQGQPFSPDQLGQAGANSGLNATDEMNARPYIERRMNRQMGLNEIQQMIDRLMEELAAMGMSDEAQAEVREKLEANAAGLAEQVSQYVGASLAERMADREPDPKPDLQDVPFTRLGDEEVAAIREEIRRLAARLRSRAALRQRRARTGQLDPRRMMRANMRYDGVPLEMRFRTHHVKPALVLICDISTSMRYCAEFLLTLVYALQDQVAKTNSYVFIGDLVDISMVFAEQEPMRAIETVLRENRPGSYNTDLGNSLATFQREHAGVVSHKTTLILVGDGRNNYNDPRIDIVRDLQRKARRVLWFNPEHPSQWGTGDSDMLQYAPASDGVYRVSTLRELAAAVDQILVDR